MRQEPLEENGECLEAGRLLQIERKINREADYRIIGKHKIGKRLPIWTPLAPRADPGGPPVWRKGVGFSGAHAGMPCASPAGVMERRS